MGFTIVYDATHADIGSLPAGGVKAGYVTGSGGIAWTADDWAKYPDAVHIDQTPVDTPWDATADVDDMEQGAVRLDELAARAKLRLMSFENGIRPGQRKPLIYASANNITPVVNALIAGGVTSGVGLWVANWNLTEAQAVADVLNASGPFPIQAVQYRNAGPFDMSVFDSAWLANVSRKPVPAPTPGSDPFEVQVERYQPGFGWVLESTFHTAPGVRYRARVSNGTWSDWFEFNPV